MTIANRRIAQAFRCGGPRSPTVLRAAALLGIHGVCLLATAARAEPIPENASIDGVAAQAELAVAYLARDDTGPTLQSLQRDVVRQLDALISELEQQQRRQPEGSAPDRAAKPAAESTIRDGSGAAGPLQEASRTGSRWGTLPPHRREQISQSLEEGFPTHYRQVLERYFRWLAGEQPAPTTPVPQAPADVPLGP